MLIHHFSDCAAPLTDLSLKSVRGSVEWTPAAEAAFVIKSWLTAAHVFRIPAVGNDAMFTMATDATDVGIGAVLLKQGDDGESNPCAYYARKLLPAERRYSAYDKETLSQVLAVRQWRTYLLDGCRGITIVTHHATLIHLLQQS